MKNNKQALVEKWTTKIKQMSPTLSDDQVKLLAECASEAEIANNKG